MGDSSEIQDFDSDLDWRFWVDTYACPSMKDEDWIAVEKPDKTLHAAKKRCAHDCRNSADCEIADLYYYKVAKYDIYYQLCSFNNKTTCGRWHTNRNQFRHVLIKVDDMKTEC